MIWHDLNLLQANDQLDCFDAFWTSRDDLDAASQDGARLTWQTGDAGKAILNEASLMRLGPDESADASNCQTLRKVSWHQQTLWSSCCADETGRCRAGNFDLSGLVQPLSLEICCS